MTPAVLGIVAALSWGAHDLIGRFASRAIGQFAVTLGVMLTGALLLTGVNYGQESLPGLTGRSLAICAAAGASYALATLFLFSAYRIGSLSIVSPLVGAYPALVIVWNVALLGSRPSAWAWIAMLVVMAGTAIVSAAGTHHEEQGHVERGRLKLMLAFSGLSALCYAVSVIAGQTATPLLGELHTTWFARGFAVLTLVPLLVLPAMRQAAPVVWWPAIAVMGLFDTLAMFCVFRAGQMPEAEIAAVTGSSFGGVVALLGWLFLKEPVTLAQWGGIALIFAGTGILTLGW